MFNWIVPNCTRQSPFIDDPACLSNGYWIPVASRGLHIQHYGCLTQIWLVGRTASLIERCGLLSLLVFALSHHVSHRWTLIALCTFYFILIRILLSHHFSIVLVMTSGIRGTTESYLQLQWYFSSDSHRGVGEQQRTKNLTTSGTNPISQTTNGEQFNNVVPP